MTRRNTWADVKKRSKMRREKKIKEAEEHMKEHKAVKVSSLWWSPPNLMGILEDGKRILFPGLEVFLEVEKGEEEGE